MLFFNCTVHVCVCVCVCVLKFVWKSSLGTRFTCSLPSGHDPSPWFIYGTWERCSSFRYTILQCCLYMGDVFNEILKDSVICLFPPPPPPPPPHRVSNCPLDSSPTLCQAAIKAGLYSKAVQVCYIPSDILHRLQVDIHPWISRSENHVKWDKEFYRYKSQLVLHSSTSLLI